MRTATLRLLARYFSGTHLVDELRHTEDIIRQQRDGLNWAADEIDRLNAELEAARAAASLYTVKADGPDSGTTRAPQE